MKLKKCGFKDIDLICIIYLYGDYIFGFLGFLLIIGNSGCISDLIIVGLVGIVDCICFMRNLVEYVLYILKIIENF